MEKAHLEALTHLHNALLAGHDTSFRIEDLDKVLNPVRKSIVALLEVCDESTREWFTSNYSRAMTRILPEYDHD